MNTNMLRVPVRALLFAAALGGGLMMPGLVSAEGNGDMLTRLDRLQVQADQLNQTLQSLGADGFERAPDVPVVQVAQSRDVAAANVRISNLEEQVRVLTGQVQGLQFQMTQFQTLLERLQDDMDFRFEQIDPSLGKTDAATPSGGAMPSGGLPQSRNQTDNQGQDDDQSGPMDLGGPSGALTPDQVPQVPLAPDAQTNPGDTNGPPMDGDMIEESQMANLDAPLNGPPLDLTLRDGSRIGATLGGQPLDLDTGSGDLVTDADADAQYKAGYEAIVQGDYAFAEQQFKQYVALFPDNQQAPDATNWLGEAMLQRGEYSDAAQVLFDGFTRYQGTVRAPDLLLKLGIALAGAGETETACRTFDEVLKRYPDNGNAFTNRVHQEQAAAPC